MTELEIIESIKKGNNNDFSTLVDSYQNQLSCYLLSKCHNRQDAEDILQETFISAYKYLHSYNPEWKFSTWLFTIAKRLLSKHYKKSENTIYETEPLAITTTEDENLFVENIWITIKATVNKSSFDTLWFYYCEEFSIKEIAQILHCSQSWVKMTLYRSKKKLAKNTEIKSYFEDCYITG
jgi:RNA polymerase sigma-70 factor (ECF subfamily)